MSIAEKLQTVAENVPKVYNAGYEKGKAEGGGDDFQSQFWNSRQKNGELTDYRWFGAGQSYTDENFKPIHNMVMAIAEQAFVFTGITDLKSLLEKQDVSIDTSQAKSFNQFCFNSSITHLPILNVASCTNFPQAFRGSEDLVSMGLENIIDTADFTYTFVSCNSLVDFYCTGIIGKSISFSYSSKLSTNSVDRIINCLADLTGQTAQTLTLHATVKAKLTDEQISTITSKNWTLA